MTMEILIGDGSRESMEEVAKTGKWFAPSMFLTNYGHYGWKCEVQAYKHSDEKYHNLYFNVDSNLAGRPKGKADVQKKFWGEWNKTTDKSELIILKKLSGWGL